MEGSEDNVVPKFNDKATENFYIWKLGIRAILRTRGCLNVVLGTETRPTINAGTANTQEMFGRKSEKATAIIITALGDRPPKPEKRHSE